MEENKEIKIKWKVDPAPTGRYRSFEKRGWPRAEYDDGQLAASIICESDYIPRNVKEGKHADLKIIIYDYSSGKRVMKSLKLTERTLQGVKDRVKIFLNNHKEYQPKEKRKSFGIIKIDGQIEIDQERGVIYFHSNVGHTVLRICSLPTPIPDPSTFGDGIDITHMNGCSWKKS